MSLVAVPPPPASRTTMQRPMRRRQSNERWYVNNVSRLLAVAKKGWGLPVLAAAMLPVHAAALDIDAAADAAESMMKLRCSLDPSQDVVAWWKGTLFQQETGKAPVPLMGFEGYNICRSEKQADGTWRMLSRELTFYRDLKTGQILESWDNPISGKRNTVVDVANDPVNQAFNPPGRPPMALPWMKAGDRLMLTLNIPLSYPNPLQPDAFPLESSGPVYAGSEHFMFFASRKDMENPALKSVPLDYSWTRTGPWLPWMELGQRPGGLLYVAQGAKLDSLDDLPQDIRERVRTRYPQYAKAPAAWTQPNVTSWTYYRDLKHKPAAKD